MLTREGLKETLKVICLFVANFFAGYLFLFGVMLGTFRMDFYLGLAICLFALPVLVIQPWYFIFYLIPSGHIWAPVGTTLLTYVLLRKFSPEQGLFKASRFFRWQNFLILGALCFVSGGCLLTSRILDFPALRTGYPDSGSLPPNLDNWIKPESSRYYVLNAFMGSEFLLKAQVAQEDLDPLLDAIGLARLKPEQSIKPFEKHTPFWWNPTLNARTVFASTDAFPMQSPASEQFHAFASWHPEDASFYLWVRHPF
jgi:hypothetical protein